MPHYTQRQEKKYFITNRGRKEIPHYTHRHEKKYYITHRGRKEIPNYTLYYTLASEGFSPFMESTAHARNVVRGNDDVTILLKHNILILALAHCLHQ